MTTDTFRFDETLAPGQTQRAVVSEGVGEPRLPALSLGGTSPGAAMARGPTLGSGGMGVVTLVHDRVLERDVAVKELHERRPSRVAALVHEARMMGSLEHPNIVPVHVLGEVEGGPALVMKRVSGATWQALLDDEEHPHWAKWNGAEDPLERHVEILEQVCQALGFAHARGVVHRDVKPDNVMVGEHGEVYLLDFGVAEREGVQTTHAAGTPAYMAPEMTGPSVVHPAMDIFLLGATLTQVLTGRARHPGKSVAEALAAAAVASPVHFAPFIDAELGRLANHACARRPEDRPGSAEEVLRELRHWRRHRITAELLAAARRQLAVLRALEADGDVVARHRALSAAQFGLQQVLEQQPDHEGARQDLVDMLTDAVASAVERRVDLDRAEAWIDDLRGLGRDTAALEAELAAAREAVAAQQLAARDLDMDAGVYRRAGMALVLALMSLALVGGAMVTGWTVTTVEDTLAVAVAFAAVMVPPALYSEWDEQGTRASRMFVRLVFLDSVALLANRLGSWWHDVPVHWVLAIDLLVLAVIALTAGAFFRGTIRVFGVVCALGFLAVVSAPPSWAFWLFALTLCVIPWLFVAPAVGHALQRSG